ncbi:DNA translocase FtsK [Bacillus sp. FJAT-27986]|uniref:DNA translocase FtsK n=1 Tax=Bacillus sp. FJAT-27986 TaxID=1743146 RepID=UPI00080AF5E2|nr:DNA translocase FtsK [Bacillus sp. FJAT-27986]OCA81871.1 hypothetical protein A8L44_14835 [Bacillus sp. FJAT-27986]
MSFFKKIIDWFYEDVEEEVEVEPRNSHENIQKKPKQVKRQKENQIEIEARIQYRYPKDNFKFPLISDEELIRLKEQKKKQNELGVKKEVHVRRFEKSPAAVPKLKVSNQRIIPKPEPKQNEVVPNKKPFRRTEIPSPIYGFQNRQAGTKNQKTVEYELPPETTLDSVLALMHGKKVNPPSVNQEPSFEMERQNELPLNPDFKHSDEEIKEEQQKVSTNDGNRHTEDIESVIAPLLPDTVSAEDTEVAATSEIAWNPVSENQIIEEMNEAILNADYEDEITQEEGIVEEDTLIMHSGSQMEQEEFQSIPMIHQNLDEQADDENLENNFGLQPEEPVEDYYHSPSGSEVYEDIEEADSDMEEDQPYKRDEIQQAHDLITQTHDSVMNIEENHQVSGNDEKNIDISHNEKNGQDIILLDGTEDEFSIKDIQTNEPVSNESIASFETQSIDRTNGLEKSAQLDDTENHIDREVSLSEPNSPMEATVTSDAMDEEERRKIEREKRIRERRKHIPFNVLMLKNDKDHIAANRNQKTIAGKEEKPSEQPKKKLNDSYQYPDISILKPRVDIREDADWLAEQAALLDDTLEQFNVKARVHTYSQGPSVTRFEVQPDPGVKVSKITNLNDDLKLSLAAKDIRIEAPIPGKRMIGIEIPNINTRPVYLREVLEEKVFAENTSPLSVAVGLDISGNPIVTDLKKMPHGLVAGSTGSGKSVFINSVLISLLYKSHPSDVRLLLIDPKMVELAPYNNIPHLAAPVITDVKAATAALKWAVEEMERRYELFAHSGVRDIVRYNEKALSSGQMEHKLPYLVIVIDELADLMMMSPADVEEAICRIAQKARACGIHLLVATQRPSVDVITGLIKANIPTRIAFSVSSQVDSRTILDQSGAEKLLGRGDMLFLENGTSKTVRLQGTFVTDDEIEDVVKHVMAQAKPSFMFEPNELVKTSEHIEEKDELYYEVCEFAVEMGGASISSLQRRFRIGYNRAARLIDMLEKEGILSESKGSKPRDVLISESDLEAIHESQSPF